MLQSALYVCGQSTLYAEGVISSLPLDGAVCILNSQSKRHNFQRSLSQVDKNQETESEKSSTAKSDSESESRQVPKTFNQAFALFVLFCVFTQLSVICLRVIYCIKH